MSQYNQTVTAAYTVHEDVRFETHTSAGAEVFDFKAGPLDPTDAERDVLERELIPAGLASRAGDAPSTPEDAPSTPEPDAVADAPTAPEQES